MKFSIIIPTYNHAHYLPGALDSIVAQTDPDYEVIVIDDGSNDQTQAVIQPYLTQHPDKIRYYFQSNQGQGVARNFGAQQAQGEFVLSLDADDRLLPEALSILNEAAQQSPEADLIIAQHISLYEDGSRKTHTKPLLSSDKKENFLNYLRKKFSIPHGAHLLRRAVYDTIQYPHNILGREDFVFFSQVLANYTAVTINQSVVEIHKHSDSFRHQLDQQYGNLEIVNTLFNPQLIPAPLMRYKKEFMGRLCLSFFRDHYQTKNYQIARYWYYKALMANPVHLLQWRYFSKFLRSLK